MAQTQEHSVWRLKELGKGPTALKLHREPVPVPGPGQYLVRIHFVSLNYRDIAYANGTYAGANLEKDLVLCADMAGEIVSGGENTSKFQPGDKVTSLFDQGYLYGTASSGREQVLGGPLDGCLQQYRVFSEITLLRSPDYLAYDELSTFPIAAVTAWNALYGLKPLVPGQTVLLQGTGGTSIFGLLIAKAAGARTIITSSSDAKLELATKLGATHTVNYKRTPDWSAEVQKLTNGAGAHHIIDTVGINEIEKCLGCVAPGGIITSIGVLGGEPKANPNIPLLTIFKQAILRGIIVGSKQQFEELLQFAEFNQIHPHTVIGRQLAHPRHVAHLASRVRTTTYLAWILLRYHFSSMYVLLYFFERRKTVQYLLH